MAREQTNADRLRELAGDIEEGYGIGDWSMGWSEALECLHESADQLDELTETVANIANRNNTDPA